MELNATVEIYDSQPTRVQQSRMLTNGAFGYDRTPLPKDEQDYCCAYAGGAIAGMEYLQIARNRGVVGHSMLHSLTYLRNQLSQPKHIHTPDPQDVNWFHHTSVEAFTEATKDLNMRIQAVDNRTQIWLHPAFEGLRQCKTAVWAVRIGPSNWEGIVDDRTAHWVLLVANFIDRPPALVLRGMRFEYTDTIYEEITYFDRSVYDFQLFDPLFGTSAERQARAHKLRQMFSLTCQRAGIAIAPGALTRHESQYPKTMASWQSGFYVYGLAQEYFRRVHIRQSTDLSASRATEDFFKSVMWADYVGMHSLDVLRESMLAACASRAALLSNYSAKIAVELPGRNTFYRADALRPDFDDPVHGRLIDVVPIVGDDYIGAHERALSDVAVPW